MGAFGEDAGDDGIEGLQRRDLDDHAADLAAHDRPAQLFPQLQRQPVVDVDLNGDEQELAETKNRDVLHRLP